MASRTTHTYTVTVHTIGGGEFTATDGENSRLVTQHGRVFCMAA